MRMRVSHFSAGLAFLLALVLLAACAGPGVSATSAPASVSVSSAALVSSTSVPGSVSMPVSSVGSSSSIPVAEVTPTLGKEYYPTVDGSTATMPLMAKIYSEVCGVPLEEAEKMVKVTQTTNAWRRILVREDENLLLLVYEASSGLKEWDRYSAAFEELEIYPIGRDALVFLVNNKNRVSNLSKQQLRNIYTGKTTNWSRVGGTSGPIAAYQRNVTSGSHTLFLELLMQGAEPIESPTQWTYGEMGGMIEAVASYDGAGGAIGYSVYYYAKEMYANPDLKMLAVDGVMPSYETIADGSYPLTNDFYVVIRKDEPEDSPARLLMNWILSDAGRQALIDAGYVPIR